MIFVVIICTNDAVHLFPIVDVSSAIITCICWEFLQNFRSGLLWCNKIWVFWALSASDL